MLPHPNLRPVGQPVVQRPQPDPTPDLIADTQRAQAQAAKQREQESAQQAKEAQRARNAQIEAEQRRTGRPAYTDAYGNIQFSQTDQEYQQKQADEAAYAQQYEAWKKEDRPLFQDRVTKRWKPIHSDEQWQQQRAQKQAIEAEKTRKAALDDELKAHDARSNYEAVTQGRKPLTDTERTRLEKERAKASREAVNTLLPKLTTDSSAVTGGNDWVPFNEAPTGDATKAKARADALRQKLFSAAPDAPVDLGEDDLADLEKLNPALAKTLKSIPDTLTKDAENQTWQQQVETKRKELILRRDDPKTWEAMQRQKMLADPEADAQDRAATFQQRQAEFGQRVQAINAQAQQFEDQLSQIQRDNEEAVKQGLAPDDLLTLTDPATGQTHTWSKSLYSQAQQIEEQRSLWAQESASMRATLEADAAALKQDQALLAEADTLARKTREQARAAELDKLRQSGNGDLADALTALDAEAFARQSDLADMYPDGVPPDAQAALESELKARAATVLEQNDQRAAAGAALYRDLKQTNPDWDWTQAGKDQAAKIIVGNVAKKHGLTPEQAQQAVALHAAADWSKGDTKAPSRVLPSGVLSINPDLTTDEAAYKDAVEKSAATPDAKKAALERLPQIQRDYAIAALPVLTSMEDNPLAEDSVQDFLRTVQKPSNLYGTLKALNGVISGTGTTQMSFNQFVDLGTKLNPDFAALTPADQAAQYLKLIKERGWFDKFKDQINTNFATGTIALGQQAVGAAAWITGSEGLSKLAVELGTPQRMESRRLEMQGANSDVALRTAGSLAGAVPSLLPGIAAGGIGGAVGAMTAATKPAQALMKATGILAKAKTMADATQSVQAVARSLFAQGTAVATSAAAAGGQTLGSVFADAYKTYTDNGMEHNEAVNAARVPAILSAFGTAALTAIGGAGGVEALFKAKAVDAAKEITKTRFRNILAGMGKEALQESWEEGFDQLWQGIVEAGTFNPGKKITEIIADALQAAAIGGVLGGTVGGIQASAAPGIEPSASRLPPVHQRPETLTAAQQAIDTLALPDATPEVLEATKATAAAILAVAQRDIDQLTDAELAPLGVTRTASGDLENTKGTSEPRVKIENGKPIITQSTLDRLQKVLPAVRAAIGLDEAQARAALTTSPTTSPDKAGVTSGGATSPGAQNAARPSDSGNPATRGLPVETAASAATGAEDTSQGTAGAPPAAAVPAPDYKALRQNIIDKKVTDLDAARQVLAAEPAENKGKAVATLQQRLGMGYKQAATLADLISLSQADASQKAASQSTSSSLQPPASRPLGEAEQERARQIANALAGDLNDPTPEQTATAERYVREKGITHATAAEQFAKDFLPWQKGQVAKVQAADGQSGTPAKSSSAANSTPTLTPSDGQSPATGLLDDPNYDSTRKQVMADITAKLPPSQRKKAKERAIKIITHLVDQVSTFGAAFKGVKMLTDEQNVINDSSDRISGAAGLSVASTTITLPTGEVLAKGTLLIHLPSFVAAFDTDNSSRDARDVATSVNEEVIHAITLSKFSQPELAALWKKLPQALQSAAYKGYWRKELPKTPLSEGQAAAMSHEFLRMLVQDKAFRLTTEQTIADNPSLKAEVARFLRELATHLRKLLSIAPRDIKNQVEEYEAQTLAALKEILAAAPKTLAERTAAKNTPAAAPNLANEEDGRKAKSQTAIVNAKPNPIAGVEGSTGTAYTDNNDAVAYRWRAVEVASLVISNDDKGTINPDYPQILQPRDRSSAGSEAQVQDIAVNANLSRLSHSASVGDGAPIVSGQDSVAESGNGRLMGLRRAYQQGMPSASKYRDALIQRAAEFGLDAEQVKGMNQPVLVRERTTEVDRSAFVLAANVSNIAPKREVETAKTDAAQMVPDLFLGFTPDENGDFLNAQNHDFIRAFVRDIVPPAERPGIIDSRGQLSQTGYRRIRNALFVYAYGTSPEALNALSSLTEATDADGRNISNALVAAAPTFAELSAREQAGALYPLSITGDLVAAVQAYADAKRNGDKIADVLAQDNIPGIDGGLSTLQKDILTTLDAQARSPRRLMDILARYAAASDHAGDPRQASLFGDAKPEKATLWKLASGYNDNGQSALATNRPNYYPSSYPSKEMGPYQPDYSLPLTNGYARSQAMRQKGQRILARMEKDWAPLFATVFNRALPLEKRKRALAKFYNQPFTRDLEFPPYTTLAEMLGQEEGKAPRTLATAARPISMRAIRPIPEDLARAKQDRAANNARWQRARTSDNPIILLELDGPDEAYQIVDGHHRFLTAQLANRPTIQAYVWPKAPTQAPDTQKTATPTLGRGLSALLGSPMPARQAMHAFTRLSTLADKTPLKTGQQEQLARAEQSLADLFQFENASFVSPAPAPALTREQRQTRQIAIDAGLSAPEADQAARMPDFAARAAEITEQTERLDQENLRRAMQSAGFDAASIARATVGTRNWSPLLTQRLRNLLTDKQTLASNRPAPGIAEAFPNWSYGYDAYGLPNPPRTLPDGDPLLQPTAEKKTARLRADHPLVTGGMLTAGVDIPRKALQRALVAYFVNTGTPVQPGVQPTLFATGGGGGAGKSSILKRLVADGRIDTGGAITVNSDDIKELIPEFEEIKAAGDGRAAAIVHEESSEIAKNLMDRLLSPQGTRYHIIFDATLSNGDKAVKQMETWKSAGYFVRLIGITIDPADAMFRASLRAKGSGRWVPNIELAKAHAGFNRALPALMAAADAANLYDNTPPNPHELAEKTTPDGPISVVNSELYAKVKVRENVYERAPSTLESRPAEGDPMGSSAGTRGGESPGSTTLREAQPESEGSRSPGASPAPQSLATARRGGDTGEQLNLFDLLTPAQQDAKLSQPDLFAGTAYEKPRPTPQRPAQPARRPSPASPRGEAPGFGELFGTSGMGTAAAGAGRPGQQPSPGLPGFGGAGGYDAASGTEAGNPGLDPRAEGNADRRPGADLSGMPGDAGDFDAYTFLRPDVGSPARNFEVPAGVESLAPATDRAKILANIEAIRLLKQLETDQRNATPEEKATLASYTGWGAFKEAFNSKYEEDIASYWDSRPNKTYMPDWLQSWERNHRPLHKLLRENMTEDEFASASASTLNAHYTAAPIIRAMWKMVERLGFTGGRALEPSAGAGHYLGLAPSNIANKTAWQTVELDDLSARLLAKLYPEATVNEERGGDSSGAFTKPDGTYYSPASRRVTGLGFERARIPNGSLDLVISNVPFHESGPKKKGFPNLNLHNFFFAHALDKVKPGGLVAFITSESTMQNNMKQRDFIASKGDLVAAFRLPNNAFKGNAGTEVTTDIIILRKPDGTPFKGKPWRNLTEVGRQTITMTQGKDQTVDEFIREAERTGTVLNTEGRDKKIKPYWKGEKRALDVSAPIMVNEYFVANPANVLGEHTLASTMYRAGGYAVVAPDGLDVPARLDALVDSLPANVMGKQDTGDVKDIVLASRDDKPFSFKEQDGKLYEVQPDGSMEEAEWSTNPDFVKTWRSWKRVSNAVEELVAAESSNTSTDEGLDRMRRDLNTIYDTHIAQHGSISRRFANKHRHLRSDPSYPLTSALENEVITVDTKTGKKTYSYRKADIFKQRIGRPIVVPTTAKNVDDALEKSLAWKGRVDADYSASLLGITPQQFEAQALQRPDIFRNPDTGLLEQGEEYLAGNVRQKLEAAQAALEDNPAFQKNVDALLTAQPERKEIARISPVLGARWIPAPVYQAFIRDVLQGSDTVEYVPAGNSWMISGTGLYRTEEHGTERKGPASLFKHALDMTEPLVYDGSGDDRAINPTETAAARAALDKMRRAFIDYVKTSDSQVTIDDKTVPVWEATEDAFNESQNSYVTPRHTGAYLTFPGLNTDYVYTRAHRRSVIARFLTTRRGMMAHGVGSGKTFNQIILAQEMRRLGLAKKPMIVVQNATLGQFAKSYLKAYPSAKILVPTKADFEAQNRRRLVAKIATGNWDAVILPHSQFDLISNKESAVKAYMDGQIDELVAITTREKDKAKVRDMEGMIKRLKDRRQDMLDKLKARQDTAVMWEDLGIDALIMDEAHNYKSLPIITKMGRVKGVPASSNSQRAINFMLKCRDVQSRTGGKNIFLATGTPIKNSMAEAYIMLQFMAPDVLEDFKIYNFDDFATTYGQTVTEAEMAWVGAPKMETRFAKFQNGNALVTMIRTMFDVAFGNDKLGLDVPKIKGGEPAMVIVPATESINQFNAWTRSVDEKWKSPMTTAQEKEEFTAVPIQTMAAGIAAALDPRLIAPTLPDDPASKVNTALKDVLRIYKEGTAKRTTQIIFSDLRNPFSMDYLLPFTGHPFPDHGSAGEFDLYKDIKAKLIAGGVPEKEVHLMQSGMTDVQKAALFEKVDNGEIRIIVGSTELLGVGVNIQTRLKAVHHLMPPRDFTPAMMEQRNGRIIRQGNLHAEKVEGQPAWNDEVEVINYGTEGSMDSAIYGTLARKQRFITQLLMGEDVQDTFDDPTDPVAVNMAEMAARTLGDPDFIRRIELEKEVKELRLLSDAYTNEVSGKRARLSRLEKTIANFDSAIAEASASAEQYAKLWTRTAPPPAHYADKMTMAAVEKLGGLKEWLKDKAVYEFGGQTIDTADKDGAITNKLDLWLLDRSKTAERQGKTYATETLTINGQPLTLRIDLTFAEQPTGGAVLDNRSHQLTNYSGAASLIQNLRRLPSDAQENVERLKRTNAQDELTAQNLRAALDKVGPFPDAAKLAALEQEAQEVDARLRAKSTPPEQQGGTPAPELILPPLQPADPKLLTEEVMSVLENVDYLGNKVFIQEQLEPRLYKAVNKALESAGGQWNKRAKAHLFSGDPRPYLGLAPLPSTDPASLATNRPAGQPAADGVASSYADPYTGHTSYITGSALTREQGRAASAVHAQRLQRLLGPRPQGQGAPPTGEADRRRVVPRLSEAQFTRIQSLPVIGRGSEAEVYADRAAGVVYKILFDNADNPSHGIFPEVQHDGKGRIDWNLQPAELVDSSSMEVNPALGAKRLAERLAVQSLLGGTPTEIAGVGPDAYVVIKQPLAPDPDMTGPTVSDATAPERANARAGLVPIPAALVADADAPTAYIAVVMVSGQPVPYLIADTHRRNYVADNQGIPRLNDTAVARLTDDLLRKVPDLAPLIQQATDTAQSIGDRTFALFSNRPAAAWAFNQTDKAFTAAVGKVAKMITSTAPAQALADYVGNSRAGQFFDKAFAMLKKQAAPLSAIGPEALALYREMQTKSAFGKELSMDVFRALDGKGKFTDLAYPPGFANNTAAKKDLYLAMTGGKPMSELSPELQTLAGQLRALLVKAGQEAVSAGRMSTDTFQNLTGTYLPHYYAQDGEQEAVWTKAARVLGIKDVLAQRTTAWHLVDTETADSKTGKKGDEGALVTWDDKGTQWRFRSGEHLIAFYNDFIKDKVWDRLRGRRDKELQGLTRASLDSPESLTAYQRGIVREMTLAARARYKRKAPLTIEEQEKAGLLMDPVYSVVRYLAQMHHDNAVAEFFNAVAANTAWTSDTQVTGYKQIPDNRRYGRLAGKYVIDSLADQVLDVVPDDGSLMELYDDLVRLWSSGKTVWNPGTHVRNFVGNIPFAQFAGVNPLNPANFSYYKNAVSLMRGDDRAMLKELYEQGVVGADYSSTELRGALRGLLPDPGLMGDKEKPLRFVQRISRALLQVAPDKIARAATKTSAAVHGAYQWSDEFFKIAAYLKAKQMGMDPKTAAEHVRKWFPYYDTIGSSGALRFIRRIHPFFSFFRESIRIGANAARERPLMLATSMAIPYVLTQIAMNLLGLLDDRDREEVLKDMRGKLKGTEALPVFSVLLPWRSQGRLAQFDMSNVHPFTKFLSQTNDTTGDGLVTTMAKELIASSPFSSILYTLAANEDPFNNRVIVQPDMTPAEAAAEQGKQIWTTLAPPLLGSTAAMIASADERSTNKTLEKRNLGQALIRGILGLDVRNASPDLYRVAEDFRKANGLTEDIWAGGTTAQQRMRKDLFAALVQDEPNLRRIKGLLERLRESGKPVDTQQDINRLLFYRNPAMLIEGRANQTAFQASLSPEVRALMDSAQAEFQRVQQTAPSIIAQARGL